MDTLAQTLETVVGFQHPSKRPLKELAII